MFSKTLANALPLMNKYNMNGPRYTSYPTALEFNTEFTEADFCQAVADSEQQNLSLYIHIPFCHKLCYYCGCNKIVTRHKHKADEYLFYLMREIGHRAQQFRGHKVVQVHFGGGTPSFLSESQFSRIVEYLNSHFNFTQNVEMSIEIDPREIELGLLDHLHDLGFNRLSIGVQDTNLEVQQAINRVQDLDFIKQLIHRGKSLGFNSINLDVIYGLPHQTPARFEKTLQDILACHPDRISLFSYAHLPTRFAAQQKIKDHWLPTANVKLSLMIRAMEVFTENGYIAIGMDHFAKPDDALALAQKRGQLHRNFQGYTTTTNCDLLGFGVSSISAVGASFSQNSKTLKAYYQSIKTQRHGLEKGRNLTRDDLIRADVIKQIMCNFVLAIAPFEQRWQIQFSDYFARELGGLIPFIEDGMVSLSDNKITVTESARLFVRTICMTFDKYMANQLTQRRFSRVI